MHSTSGIFSLVLLSFLLAFTCSIYITFILANTLEQINCRIKKCSSLTDTCIGCASPWTFSGANTFAKKYYICVPSHYQPTWLGCCEENKAATQEGVTVLEENLIRKKWGRGKEFWNVTIRQPKSQTKSRGITSKAYLCRTFFWLTYSYRCSQYSCFFVHLNLAHFALYASLSGV